MFFKEQKLSPRLTGCCRSRVHKTIILLHPNLAKFAHAYLIYSFSLWRSQSEIECFGMCNQPNQERLTDIVTRAKGPKLIIASTPSVWADREFTAEARSRKNCNPYTDGPRLTERITLLDEIRKWTKNSQTPLPYLRQWRGISFMSLEIEELNN